MVTASAVAAHPSNALSDGVLVLRWTYRRRGETLICELALTQDFSAYELYVSHADLLDGAQSQLFDDAICAFQRQVDIERTLVDDGWYLDRFDRERRPAS